MKFVINGRFLLQPVTGVQRVAIELTKALDQLLKSGTITGIDVEVIAPARGEQVTILELDAIRIRRGGSLAGHLWEQFDLPRLAGSDPLLCLGNVAPLPRLLRRKYPTYVMVHDLSYRYFPSAYSRSFRLFYGISVPLALWRSAHVFTVSRSEEMAMLKNYPRLVQRERLSAVQNGGGLLAAPADALPPMTMPRSGVLYVGSLSRRKNAPGLISAAERVARASGTIFTFVGSTARGLKEFESVVDSEVRPHLRFLGQINDPNEIAEQYRQASVFLFPSFYEASPLPPIEAMSHGCPVVCSDIPSLRERCGDAAVYCDPSSVDSIVDALEEVLSDPSLWSDLQRRGYERAREFTWKEQAKAIMSELGVRDMGPDKR